MTTSLEKSGKTYSGISKTNSGASWQKRFLNWSNLSILYPWRWDEEKGWSHKGQPKSLNILHVSTTYHESSVMNHVMLKIVILRFLSDGYLVLQKYHLVRIYGNKSKIRNKHNFNHFLTNLRYFSAILMERQITQIFMAFQHKKMLPKFEPKNLNFPLF